MNCPKDSAKLNSFNYESNIEVERCVECHGFFLDAGELENIQKTIANDYSEEFKSIPSSIVQSYKMAKAKSEKTYSCPKCHSSMEKKEHGFSSQIMVDTCVKCRSIWLDSDELKSLEVFFEQSKNKAEKDEKRKGFFSSFLNLK
jgi:Zn-finger nucleic acid-binding protein